MKLFAQILTSSIWLESDQTLRVWITLLAAMDQDGFAHFASVRNLAQYARVSDDDCQTAVQVLESPDPDSADDSNEGRRIERVPGGWMVLNAAKYRELGSTEHRREQIKVNVARHRARQKADVIKSNQDVITCNQCVISGNHDVTKCNHMQKQKKNKSKREYMHNVETHVELPKPATSMNVDLVFTHWKETLKHPDARLTAKRQQRILQRLKEGYSVTDLCAAIDGCAKSAFHMGENANAKVYDDIELICRSGEKVEQFKDQTAPLGIPKPQSRVGAQAKPVAVENDRADSAEIISTWNDLADAMGEPLEKLVKKSVALGQLSKDDARMILGESNAQ